MVASRDTSQDCNSSVTSTTCTATYPATATANKFLVAICGAGDQAANLTGPSGWTKAVDFEHNSQTFCGAIYFKGAAGSETGATFSVPSSTTLRVAAFQYSGMLTASVLDAAPAGTQSGASQVPNIATGSAATAQADELIISLVHINGNGTNIGWANGTELFEGPSHSVSVAERIVSATGTYSDTASWTSNLFACAGIATFKAVASAGRPKVYAGGSWTKKPLKVYVGGSWVEKPVKRWNGSSWVALT
jgi:hypothetical protein